MSLIALLALAADWQRLPSLPDAEGFAGSFAGVSGGSLLVAGGANFPDKKPHEGGTKVWTDRVFVLDKPDGQWKDAGRLPRPLGYGICVTHGDGVVCVGGSDVTRHHADCFRLTWKDGKLTTTALPPLPRPLANACGAMLGDRLFVAGGIDRPDAKTTRGELLSIDLSAEKPRWVETELPSPRMLAVAAVHDGAFWLVGGVDLVGEKGERKYLRDAYRYDGSGWKRVTDLPRPLAAAPGPCPADADGFTLLGGDDGSNVATPPDRHPGFGAKTLRYDRRADRWADAAEMTAPRVTTPLVPWQGLWVVPSGEVRPGVRSPQVWALSVR